ncbi:shikimate dehydrogenase [Flavobacteriaceae bacterium]|nr:shikimate dehydrogenase [Flavobacteriaceae bacterium]
MKDLKKSKIYGLIGRNIDYSFSKDFFTDKFKREKLNCIYNNFDIQEIKELKKIIIHFDISGLNVTIPYKESVMKYLDYICPIAKEIGAVNTIKFDEDILSGYNTDYLGFYESIKKIVKPSTKALILGTGGASKAIAYALKLLNIKYIFVSRSKKNKDCICYNELNKEIIDSHKLIINCTPLGTHPEIEKTPQIPINFINHQHIIYDLIYNPTKSLLLEKSQVNGAIIINGYQMLKNQAIESWIIWNSNT